MTEKDIVVLSWGQQGKTVFGKVIKMGWNEETAFISKLNSEEPIEEECSDRNEYSTDAIKEVTKKYFEWLKENKNNLRKELNDILESYEMFQNIYPRHKLHGFQVSLQNYVRSPEWIKETVKVFIAEMYNLSYILEHDKTTRDFERGDKLTLTLDFIVNED